MSQNEMLRERMAELGIKDYTLVNPEDINDDFWGNAFLFQLTRVGFAFIVSGDCLQNALDELIDFLVSDSPGLISEEHEMECPENHLMGGNEGKYINTLNYRISKLW